MAFEPEAYLPLPLRMEVSIDLIGFQRHRHYEQFEGRLLPLDEALDTEGLNHVPQYVHEQRKRCPITVAHCCPREAEHHSYPSAISRLS